MAKSGKRNLKATLVSQQARLKKNEQAKNAAQVRDLKKGSKGPGTVKALDKGKGKEKEGRVEVPKRAVIPIDSTHKILLLGEGNFSFALALLKLDPHHYPVLWTHIPAYNVTATAYDTEEECYGKYPEAPKIVDELKTRGVRVLFSVDAGNLERCKALRGQTWDRVVWNFPHAGEHFYTDLHSITLLTLFRSGKGIADQDRNILANQKLLLAFLRSVAPFLAQGSIPDFNKGKKKKTSAEDDEEDEDPGEENGVDEDNEERDLSALQNQKSPSRGTILVTLRNVPPPIRNGNSWLFMTFAFLILAPSTL